MSPHCVSSLEETMHYNGFGAWCAAYAFLNTTQLIGKDPEIYELLSGVPFGIKHRENDSFGMLTPFTEPCFRVEATAEMLGYKATRFQFNDIVDAVTYLAKSDGMRFMVGPVDMGYLLHLPQNLYYAGQSHYIAIAVRN